MSAAVAVVHRGSASATHVRATLASLVGQVASVCLVPADAADGTTSADDGDAQLPAALARLVRPGLELAGVEQVLVVPAGVVLARGAVARLAARSRAPGRVVTRVLVPELEVERPVASWRASWVRDAGLDAVALAAAGVEVDRERFPRDDPRVRAWVPADEIGAALVTAVAPDARRWARATGARLALSSRLAVVRSRAGRVRRGRALRVQRRAAQSSR